MLSVDELSRYLFVWLTLLARLWLLWITPTFRSPFWWRNSPAWQRRVGDAANLLI
ncbi:hypothetical protein ACVXHB_10860 [Escherichia coli]